jgi:glycosyltransferase involved in cell wall biosynthesis
VTPPEISVVVPVYDEAESLPRLDAEIAGALRPLGFAYEVIYVDDGSIDGSAGVLRGLARDDSAVRVIRQRRNTGQTAALDAGFRSARGAVVVTLDADLQNDPADIPRLLALMDRFDVVSGVRVPRRHSWLRRVSSRVANRVRNRVTHDEVTDVGCTLRACRAELLRRVPMFAGMHRFLPTLLKMAGARTTEIPVNHRPRLYGRTKYTLGNRLWRTLADLAAVRWMQARWIDPDLSEEIDPWDKNSGPTSATSASSSSAAASWSSGSPPNGASGPSSPTRSGT